MLESILNIFRSKPTKTIYQKRIECAEMLLEKSVSAANYAETDQNKLEICKKEYAQVYEQCKEILKE